MLIDALGRPLRDLRLSVTDRCNFNCTYCMPDRNISFLPRSEILSFDEIVRVTRVLGKLGVRKVKLTGGEPTLRMGLHALVAMLLDVEGVEDLALITNGSFLKTLSRRLYDAGLRRLTVSLDALDETIFQGIVGDTHALHPVLRGIDAAAEVGFSPIKVNCVLQRGINEDQALPLAEYFRERSICLRFIEFMDTGEISWDRSLVVPSAEVLERLRQRHSLEPVAAACRGEVARRYRYSDGSAEVGFISSVSKPFCRDCTRLRMSSDGTLYGCLFAAHGFKLKPYLRDGAGDDELADLITAFWTKRRDRYSEERREKRRETEGGEAPTKRAMHYMGG